MSVRETVQAVLDDAGTTYAAEAGIKLANKPSPLYRLLVLAVLMSAPVKAEVAVAAARELAEFGTPQRMCDATWQQRVEALDRGRCTRYDERTATALGKGAHLLLDRYHGDLRRMRAKADGDLDELRDLLTEVPNLSPVGADVFCREAQLVWPELRPYVDDEVVGAARKLGLPTDPVRLTQHVEGHDIARLTAAVIRSA